ncbi:hypothetical protein B0H16DRAFT_1789072 [Mycena metata]|uniref:Uncharacterized protein n=1 Tax=Mycena metata TaxID=1033252 RepID=A0AAD7NMG8_9AGAR|nr:hypothetical protein B0H16DRAFT_1789072 [Mycena metata]
MTALQRTQERTKSAAYLNLKSPPAQISTFQSVQLAKFIEHRTVRRPPNMAHTKKISRRYRKDAPLPPHKKIALTSSPRQSATCVERRHHPPPANSIHVHTLFIKAHSATEPMRIIYVFPQSDNVCCFNWHLEVCYSKRGRPITPLALNLKSRFGYFVQSNSVLDLPELIAKAGLILVYAHTTEHAPPEIGYSPG